MNRKNHIHHSLSVVRSEQGQSLLLALVVMFLLVFLGGLFITIIARNLARSQKSGETLSADFLAETGVRYADDQFSYGPDGADWRPVPSYPDVINPPPGSPIQPGPNDPDRKWLLQGFSRFNYGKGRFLLRVIYNPIPGDPMTKFIKIESVGRMGTVDPGDPTTWAQVQSHKDKVAYKAIGITDYLRFVTNKDRRTDDMSLGTPGFRTDFGWEDLNNNGAVEADEISGAPIRVNGNLMWHGTDYLWLDFVRGDIVEVAGDILHSVLSSTGNLADPDITHVSVLNPDTGNPEPALPSGDPNFVTRPRGAGSPGDRSMGWYRDGRPVADVEGLPRQIQRLDPPILDAKGAAGGLGRYREVTRNSGEWKQYDDPDTGNPSWFNTGFYGWGNGIYINNSADIQPESALYTLRSDWTQPGVDPRFWTGPYYIPPAVKVILHPNDMDNADGDDDPATGADIELVHDISQGAKFIWCDADGNSHPEWGSRVFMPYPKNGILFAEGNIRIKGMLPPPNKLNITGVQLTVVSGATIYVDGSILRYRPANGTPDPDGAIALLAEDYVCVNTTQFFGPTEDALMSSSASYQGENSQFTISPGGGFAFDFAFGDYLSKYGDMPVNLYMRHASSGQGPSYMSMFVNYPSLEPLDAWHGIYGFDIGYDQPDPLDNWSAQLSLPNWPSLAEKQHIYPTGDETAFPVDLAVLSSLYRYAMQRAPNWEHTTFQLDPVPTFNDLTVNYDLFTNPGYKNEIAFKLARQTAHSYLLSRAAVQPCDIRIEALIYAQNGSFFVIPGVWFNPDPRDTEAKFASTGDRPAFIADNRWPFYGQPLDVRVIVSGAVSENVTASVGDQASWMEKWGWIPPFHGSSEGSITEESTTGYRPRFAAGDTRRRGLTFLYDGRFFCPRDSSTGSPIRVDEYKRMLPILPKLPVSPQTLYFGEPT